ncbi:hypothetical protein DL89DRAFT_256855 [Linderina pennispora]|uniref:Uncharacterized protein n=1 Tax=Linderina pennispora TaxID=61395 RepID=A0A1Y1WB42_9FUNG|nr:uncharacterized protein DL89DRAFT_256855 [Linderina pennispora]ORX70662.1 hypothetical protein DL89DRAFT_256855 [Linderina pennispora]
MRRLIWSSFTVDTFVSLMLHQAPNVLVDLSGVNRPVRAVHVRIKQAKLDGIRWHVNGSIVQVNFAVIGNAVLRTINDPNASVEDMDKLVLTTFESLTEWLAAVPEMPANVTAEEIQHTNADIVGRAVHEVGGVAATSVLPPQMCNGETRERMLADYISNACRLCRQMRLVTDLLENETPPMFISYALMLAGGIAAACAHSAPTRALRESFAQTTAFIKRMCKSCGTKSLLFAQAWEEIVQVEEMVTFMPKRLEKSQLLTMRDLLVPGSIEAVVDKKFTVFLHPIRHIANMPPAANSVFDDQPSEPRTRPHGGIPLTSNLCAIFGSKPVGAKIKRTASMEAATARSHQRQVPEYKMTYTSISSILVSLVVATMDEEFFAFLPELGASEQMQVRVQLSSASTEGSLAGTRRHYAHPLHVAAHDAAVAVIAALASRRAFAAAADCLAPVRPNPDRGPAISGPRHTPSSVAATATIAGGMFSRREARLG